MPTTSKSFTRARSLIKLAGQRLGTRRSRHGKNGKSASNLRIEEFYQTGAAFKVEAHTLSRMVHELLAFPEKAAAAGKTARDVYLKHSGAMDRAMKIIEAHLRT